MISINAIWTRDEGRCWLCGLDVPSPSVGTTRALRPTRDHVTPRRDGGPDHESNLRLAHSFCNEQRDRLTREEKERVISASTLRAAGMLDAIDRYLSDSPPPRPPGWSPYVEPRRNDPPPRFNQEPFAPASWAPWTGPADDDAPTDLTARYRLPDAPTSPFDWTPPRPIGKRKAAKKARPAVKKPHSHYARKKRIERIRVRVSEPRPMDSASLHAVRGEFP